MSAALKVLRRNDGEEAMLSDILEEAGLSTRAFYRHFQTKEDVIRALFERDAETFGAHLRWQIDSATDLDEALEIWVFEMLALAYDPRRAERLALNAGIVRRVVHGTSSYDYAAGELVQPLRTVLDDGLAEGVFPNARPEIDVRAISALTWELIHLRRSDALKLTREAATDIILSYARPALGAMAHTKESKPVTGRARVGPSTKPSSR
jgi:AcrR family transcriptional regulator